MTQQIPQTRSVEEEALLAVGKRVIADFGLDSEAVLGKELKTPELDFSRPGKLTIVLNGEPSLRRCIIDVSEVTETENLAETGAHTIEARVLLGDFKHDSVRFKGAYLPVTAPPVKTDGAESDSASLPAQFGETATGTDLEQPTSFQTLFLQIQRVDCLHRAPHGATGVRQAMVEILLQDPSRAKDYAKTMVIPCEGLVVLKLGRPEEALTYK